MKKEILESLDWTHLDSEDVDSITYCENNLYVIFRVKKNNNILKPSRVKVYCYFKVPNNVYERILNRECLSDSENVPSHGATLYQLVIKDKQYDYVFWEFNDLKY